MEVFKYIWGGVLIFITLAAIVVAIYDKTSTRKEDNSLIATAILFGVSALLILFT